MLFNRASIVALWALSLAACGPRASDEGESQGFYAVAGRIQSWRENAQIDFKFAKNFPYRLRHAVSLGASSYNDVLASVKTTSDVDAEISGDAHLDPKSAARDGKNGIYWLEEEWPWAQTHANSDAMTVVYFEDDQIVEADVFYRARSYESRVELWATTSENRESRLPETHRAKDLKEMTLADQWLYLITVHEVGHALGRTHTHDEDSIMEPMVELERLLEPFSSFDLETLSGVYDLRI